MHISDGVLSSEVCLATSALAISAVGVSWYKLRSATDAPTAGQVGATAALIFAGQMVNFSLPGLPASGHLLGGVLAAALLGPWAGCLAVAAVLLTQAVCFADGGMWSLGANGLNMAVIGCWGGHWLLQQTTRVVGPTREGQLLAVGISSFATVVLAALMCSLEYALSAVVPLSGLAAFSAAMVKYHAVIGVGEALLSVAAFGLILAVSPGFSRLAGSRSLAPARPQVLAVVLASCAIAALLAPWASALPDGLEAVSDQWSLTPTTANPGFWLADYKLPLPQGWESFSVSAAGVVGTLLVLAMGSLLAARKKSLVG